MRSCRQRTIYMTSLSFQSQWLDSVTVKKCICCSSEAIIIIIIIAIIIIIIKFKI